MLLLFQNSPLLNALNVSEKAAVSAAERLATMPPNVIHPEILPQSLPLTHRPSIPLKPMPLQSVSLPLPRS
jgi:hypothetical protein